MTATSCQCCTCGLSSGDRAGTLSGLSQPHPSHHQAIFNPDRALEPPWGCLCGFHGYAAPLCPTQWPCGWVLDLSVPANLSRAVGSQLLALLSFAGMGWQCQQLISPGSEAAAALVAPGFWGQKCHLHCCLLSKAPQQSWVGSKAKSAVLQPSSGAEPGRGPQVDSLSQADAAHWN